NTFRVLANARSEGRRRNGTFLHPLHGIFFAYRCAAAGSPDHGRLNAKAFMNRNILLLFVVFCNVVTWAQPDGSALYAKRFAGCPQDQPQPRMPTREEICRRSPQQIMRAMFGGAMQFQAIGLSPEEARAIARFVTGKEFGSAQAPAAGLCPASSKPYRLES